MTVADSPRLGPRLVREWSRNLNGDIDPRTVAAFSNKKRWWVCPDHSHDYEATVAKRSQGRGCPYCSGKKVLVGFNDLATVRPQMAAAWDYERNDDVTPEQVTEWSHRAFWWRCAEGHSWSMQVRRRSRGLGCTVCAGYVLWRGYNDLATVAPAVAASLDHTRTDLNPTQILATDRSKFPWVCHLGHQWEATAKSRVLLGSGCPVCSGNQVLAGFNDLATADQMLARQWHPTRNGELTPQHVTSGSKKRVWWLCNEGHEWKAAVYSRTTRGCRKCALRGTSRVERELFEACEGWLAEAEHLRSVRVAGKRVSLDISGVCAGVPVVVEYDGSYFHADAVERDSVKTQALLDAGYVVVRVREENHTALEPLPLVHPRLVQVSHRFGDAVEPLSDRIRVLVAELVAVVAA